MNKTESVSVSGTRSEQRATANLIGAADELRKEHPELSVVCDALADALISITTKKEA